MALIEVLHQTNASRQAVQRLFWGSPKLRLRTSPPNEATKRCAGGRCLLSPSMSLATVKSLESTASPTLAPQLFWGARPDRQTLGQSDRSGNTRCIALTRICEEDQPAVVLELCASTLIREVGREFARNVQMVGIPWKLSVVTNGCPRGIPKLAIQQVQMTGDSPDRGIAR